MNNLELKLDRIIELLERLVEDRADKPSINKADDIFAKTREMIEAERAKAYQSIDKMKTVGVRNDR